MLFEQTVEALKSTGVFFEPTKPIYITRAPGRLDVMGGNDDYTGGLVFESTISEATYAAAQLRNDQSVVLKNKTVTEAGWQGDIQISIDELKNEENVRNFVNTSTSVRWTAYVLGNLHYLLKKYPEAVNVGIQLFMESTVPFNRGVSSSAAIEVAVMKAAAAAYGIDLSGIELALACQWVENVMAESGCGIMDQAAVVLGKKGFIMPLVCQPCNPESLIQLPNQLHIWGIDSGVSHQVSGIEYEAARAAAFMGYKMICDIENITVMQDNSADISRYTDAVWNGYLANLSPAVFYNKYENFLPLETNKDAYLKAHQFHADPFSTLRDNVVYHVRVNTKYAIEENHRVQLFSELSRGASAIPSKRSFELMGELMYQSHQAYTECGLGANATDQIIHLCRKEGIANGVYGAKITGGGAGGTVAILGDKHAHKTIQKIFEAYKKLNLGNPYLFDGSSDGADIYGIKML